MKHGLIMLLVLLLSFSVMVAAADFSEFAISQENILNMATVENQDVTAPIFGGVAVLSVDSEQVEAMYFDNTIATADPYIGVEMDFIKPVPLNVLEITNIKVLRGGILHTARHYKQNI